MGLRPSKVARFLLMLLRARAYHRKRLVGLSFWVLAHLPRAFGYRLGMALGLIAWMVSKRRRHIARINLKIAFPMLASGAVRKMERAVFMENGIGFIEALWCWFNPDRAMSLPLEFSGLEDVSDVRRSRQGILMLCPHQSTLDLICPILKQTFDDFLVTQRSQKNEYLNYWMTKGRSKYGRVSDVRDMRSLVRELRLGGVAWFAPDQDMGVRSSVFANFFGKKACTVTTPSRLCKLTECAVFVMGVSRIKGSYMVSYRKVVDWFPSEDEVTNAEHINKLLEEMINKKPEQYLWMHRRYKTSINGSRGDIY